MAEFRASPQVGPGHNLSTSTHSTRFVNRRNILLHQATCGVNGTGNRGGAVGTTDDNLGPTCQRRSLAEPMRHHLSVILHHQQQEPVGDCGSTSEPARPSRVNRSSKAHQLRLDSNF